MTGKGQLNKTETFKIITSLLLPNTTKKLWPHMHPYQQRLNEAPRILTSEDCKEAPNT